MKKFAKNIIMNGSDWINDYDLIESVMEEDSEVGAEFSEAISWCPPGSNEHIWMEAMNDWLDANDMDFRMTGIAQNEDEILWKAERIG